MKLPALSNMGALIILDASGAQLPNLPALTLFVDRLINVDGVNRLSSVYQVIWVDQNVLRIV